MMTSAPVRSILTCLILAAVAPAQPAAKPATQSAPPAPKPPAPATAPATKPATRPAEPGGTEGVPAYKGAISVQAVQGTKDGPAVKGDKVTVTLFFQDRSTKVIEDQLDEHGVVLLDGLALDQPFQPRVVVHHGGLEFESVGQVMGLTQPTQKVTVKVYETIDQEPPWDVAMWLVNVRPSPHGPQVSQVLVVRNPADRVWPGAPQADGTKASLVFAMPPSVVAKNIALREGFHSRVTKLVSGQLVHTSPMLPGTRRFRVDCLIGMHGDHADVELVAPARVGRFVVVLPDPSVTVTSEQLTHSKPSPMGQSYQLANVPRGGKISFQIRAAAGTPKSTAATEDGETGSSAKTVAVVGGVAILVIALLVVFFKPRKGASSDSSAEGGEGPEAS